jgi:hypothetical protein
MSYPYKKLSAWWVVYRVNPRERLHTPDDSSYHGNQVPTREVDEVYQDDELLCSFNIDLDSTLNSLLGDANDVIFPEQRKHTLKKRNIRYSMFFIFHIIFFIFHITFMLYHITFFIFLSYYVFDEYSLVLVLNRMSKRLKSVTKKLYEGKSRARMTDTLFRVVVLPVATEQR